MPKIPIYRQQTSTPTGTPGPRLRAVDSGLTTLGDGATDLAVGLKRRQDERQAEDDRLWTINSEREFRANWMAEEEKFRLAAPAGATDYTPGLMSKYNEMVTAAVKNAPNERVAKFYESRLREHGLSVQAGAMRYQAGEQVRYRSEEHARGIDTEAKLAYAKPADAGQLLSERVRVIRTSTTLDAEQKAKLEDLALKTIPMFAVKGEIDANPGKWKPSVGYGLRPDGTPKGNGWLGSLKLPNGGTASEYSIADSEKIKNPDGSYRDYPTLVPTLTQSERDALVNDIIPNEKPIPPEIARKAEEHALKRISEGKSPFASDAESPDGPAVGSMWNLLSAKDQAAVLDYAEQKKREHETQNQSVLFVDAANTSIVAPTDPNEPIDVSGAMKAAQEKLKAQGVVLDSEKQLRLRSITEQVAANLEQDRRRIFQARTADLFGMIRENQGNLYAVTATPAGASLYSSLPTAYQDEVRTFAERTQTGGDVIRNPELFTNLDNDNVLLMNTNLDALANQLTGADRKYLEDKKQELLTTPDAVQQLESDKEAIASVTPAAIRDDEDRWGQFLVAVKAAADRELAEQPGKTKLGQKRLTEIAAEQAQIVMRKPGLLWGSTPVRRYEIPEEEREKIIELLQSRGFDEPTEAQIRALYDEAVNGQ